MSIAEEQELTVVVSDGKGESILSRSGSASFCRIFGGSGECG